MAEGTIFKFHNDLDTDQIIASQYLLLVLEGLVRGAVVQILSEKRKFCKTVENGGRKVYS